MNCYVTIIGVLLATIWVQGSKRDSSRHATTTVLASVEFARPHDPHEVDEDEDEDKPTRQIPEKALATRGGWGVRSPSIRVKSTGGLNTLRVIPEGESEEKRVSESSSSSGATVGLAPSSEVRYDAASDGEKYAHTLLSPGSRGASVAHDPILDAV